MKNVENYMWFTINRKDGKQHYVKYATDSLSEAQGRLKRDINSGEVWCTMLSDFNISYPLKKHEIKSYSIASHDYITKRRNYFLSLSKK